MAVADRPSNVAAVFGVHLRVDVFLWMVISVTNLVLLLLDPVDGVPRPGAWVTWGLLVVASAALFLPRGDPLAPRYTWVVGVFCVAAGASVFWDAPSEESGYAPWYLRAVTTLLVVTVLRRRWVAGWIASTLTMTAVLAWAATSGEDLGHWIGLIARQIAPIVVSQVTAIGLLFAARTITAYRAEERERVRSEELRSASITERRAELTTIRELAAPLLERISRGDDSPDLRDEAIVIEAALRDVLRGRRLAAEPLVTAALDARRRGVEVTLLDDLGDGDGDGGYDGARGDGGDRGDGGGLGAPELDDDQREVALAWAAERVRPVTVGSATVRLTRRDGRPVVTVLAGDDDIATREL